MEETRTTDNMGTAEVHSHVGTEPSKGQGMSGKFDADSRSGSGSGTMGNVTDRAGEMADQAREQVSNVTEQAREQVSNVTDQARNRLGDIRGRAEDVVGQARERATNLMDQAEESRPVQMARENPLPAVGIAFALGFLLAGSSDTGGRVGKAKHQVKGAIMGGLSAAIAQELKGMIGMQGGAGGMMNSLLGNQGNPGQQGGQQAGGANR